MKPIRGPTSHEPTIILSINIRNLYWRRRPLLTSTIAFFVQYRGGPWRIDIMSARPDRDSDSSDDDSEYNETKTLLGYASEDATDDAFSQLGGHPVRIGT